ncbi:MAG: A/G-specific adenine glycosylase, partial [Pseudomonadota bacterium]
MRTKLAPPKHRILRSIPDLTHNLLRWYDTARRQLPWRGENDPYRIWLSETMLQQTQVETVKPYYHKFLQQFPTLDKLAQAPLQNVLAAWAGLGYYRRAKHLHLAAQQIVTTLSST